MYCAKCGRELRDGDMFCPACGTRITGFDQISEEKAADKVSRDHISFDWGVKEPAAKKEEKSDIVFDWGGNPFGKKKTQDEGNMFKDKELVKRITTEIDMGGIRERAKGLHEGYDILKEEEEKKQAEDAKKYIGFESAIKEVQEAPKQSIDDLLDELFSKYPDEEVKPQEPVKEETPVSEVKEEPVVTDDSKFGTVSFEEFMKKQEEENAVTEKPEGKKSLGSIFSNLGSAILGAGFVHEAKEILKEDEETKEEPVEGSISGAISSAMVKDAVKEEIEEMVNSEPEEPLTAEEVEAVKEEVAKAISETVSSATLKDEVEVMLNEQKEEMEKIEDEVKDGTSIDRIFEGKNVASYSNEEREEIDNYLEKTLVYKRSSFQKAIEEAEKKETPASPVEVKEVEVAVPETEEEPPVEIKEVIITGTNAAADEEGKIDARFNTFYMKNDEFDALLKKEKEKVEKLDDDTLHLELERLMKEVDLLDNGKKEEVKAEAKEEVSTKESDAEALEALIFNEEKKKTSTEPKSATMALEELARIMEEERKKEKTKVTEPVKEEVPSEKKEEAPAEPEKKKLSRMTVTGLNLDGTYDFSDKHNLDQVPKEILDEEIDKSAMDTSIEELFEKEEKPKKKKYVLAKIIIVLLVLVMLVEAAIVVAKYVMPDSGFADIVNTVIAKVTEILGL
ncbi:MAG: zinc ribbon domain-containing protein [Clostridia bacterium]|nr:zinc ribbon domain-containing protein [Clostridia bacterium]